MKKLLFSVFALLASVSLSAQDVTAIFNEGAAAYGAKDFAGIERFIFARKKR